MINLKTGKRFNGSDNGSFNGSSPMLVKEHSSPSVGNYGRGPLTRRDAIKGGLAAILAAGVAPSLCGSITRGMGYRNLAGRMAAMGGGWKNPYVTDGLVAMWDGEWNGGGGVHLEETSKITDCVAGYELTSVGTVDIEENKFGNFYVNSSYLTTGSNVLPIDSFDDYTVELVMQTNNITTSMWNGICNVTDTTNYTGFRALAMTYTTISDFRGSNPDILQFNRNGRFTSSTSKSGEYYKGYMNGVIVRSKTNASTQRQSQGAFKVETRGRVSDRLIDGYFHCIRFYKKTLSDSQIAYNYDIDNERFNLQ